MEPAVNGHMKVGIFEVHRRRPITRTEKRSDVPQRVHPEVQGHKIRLVEVLEIDDWASSPALLRNDEHLGVVAEGQSNLLDRTLAQQCLHLPINDANVFGI